MMPDTESGGGGCGSAVAVFITFGLLLVANGLVAVGYGVKFTNAEIANTHPVYLLPTGTTFAVWGLIYLLEGIFAVYQLCCGLHDEKIALIRTPVLRAFVANVVWLFLFGYESWWAAAIVIVIYLYLLFQILERLNVNYFSDDTSIGFKVCVVAGFSANASWVTVATLLQLQINLEAEGWMPSEAFTTGEILLAVLMGCTMVFKRADLVYAAVAAWALHGIIANQDPASDWGCNSEICASCVAGLEICEQPNTSPIAGRPNGFAGLGCANWTSTSERVCVVDKSDVVQIWASYGIVAVLIALVLGIFKCGGEKKDDKEKHLLSEP